MLQITKGAWLCVPHRKKESESDRKRKRKVDGELLHTAHTLTSYLIGPTLSVIDPYNNHVQTGPNPCDPRVRSWIPHHWRHHFAQLCTLDIGACWRKPKVSNKMDHRKSKGGAIKRQRWEKRKALWTDMTKSAEVSKFFNKPARSLRAKRQIRGARC